MPILFAALTDFLYNLYLLIHRPLLLRKNCIRSGFCDGLVFQGLGYIRLENYRIFEEDCLFIRAFHYNLFWLLIFYSFIQLIFLSSHLKQQLFSKTTLNNSI